MNTASIQQTEPAKQGYQPLQLRNTTGDNLWKAGYRTFVRDACTLWIRKPDKTLYACNPYAQTCSCRATVKCKHLKSLTDLVFLSAADLEFRGDFCEAGKLYDFWTEYTFYFYAQQKGANR